MTFAFSHASDCQINFLNTAEGHAHLTVDKESLCPQNKETTAKQILIGKINIRIRFENARLTGSTGEMGANFWGGGVFEMLSFCSPFLKAHMWAKKMSTLCHEECR